MISSLSNFTLKLSLILIVGTLVSCRGTKNTLGTETTELLMTDDTVEQVTVSIKSLDLAEDKSLLSTKDDEIMLLIYKVEEGFEINEPLLKISHRFTPENREYIFAWPNAQVMEGQKTLLVMVEQDSRRKINQIDPLIRVYAEQLIKALNERDYIEIEKYLDDDDLLGIELIDNLEFNSKKGVSFSGVYLFDHYEYRINFHINN